MRTVPDPPSGGEEGPLEPRVWGWSSGRPSHSLLYIIDEEDQFVHRPYTKNFFPGVEDLHRLYQEDSFASRNIRSSRMEGVFDVWRLILRPQVLPGFIITNTISVAGGAFFPFSYRPDRLCRQFGLDQPPCRVDLEFCEVSVAMKAVLFGSNEGLPLFDSSRFIPPERSGRVLDIWVAYYARLKTAIKRYEQQDSMQNFSDILIMCKDPYYVTSSTKGKPKQEIGIIRSKKCKPPKYAKESITVPTTSEGEGGPKKKAKASEASRPFRAKKTLVLPVRASVRLREKPSNKFRNPSSSSSPVEIVKKPGSTALSTPVFDHGDDQTVQDSPSPSAARTVT